VSGAGRRAVSLVPSITETLLQWGVTPAAVTRFCEAPGLPQVGGTKNPDIAAIVALAPDVVLMDEEENRRPDHDALVEARVEVAVTRVRSLHDVEGALRVLREAVGLAPAGPAWPAEGAGAAVASVFVPIWKRPWMTIGAATYGSSLLAAAGLRNVYADHPAAYPTIDLEEAASLRPDVVLAPSEPYPFGERHRAELERVAPVRLVDGRDLFWWGWRTPAALRRLGALAAQVGGA
jgi:ABC-type Fe3+-hydroxamate transport system substrate-binding protein